MPYLLVRSNLHNCLPTGHYRKRIQYSHSNLRPYTVTLLASCKKEQRLVTPITLHMPSGLALVATPSPVLWTDASAHSLLSRCRRSRSAVSLQPSSASCFAVTLRTHASRAGSCGSGEVHPPAGRGRPVDVTDSVCCDVCDLRSVCEQSGRTTGRLGSMGLRAMPSEGRHCRHSRASTTDKAARPRHYQ